MIIAIDGPAASGKGTIARRLAARYGLPHLDTGLLYRATASALIGADRHLYDEGAAVAAARDSVSPISTRPCCAAARWARRRRSSPPSPACPTPF
jgi:cytidylate kinase